MNHLSFSQAVETVMNSEHVVALDDAHPDSGTDSGIHAGARGADVQDGNVDVALVQSGGLFIN